MKVRKTVCWTLLLSLIVLNSCKKKDDIVSISFEELNVNCESFTSVELIQNEESFIQMVKENDAWVNFGLLCCDTLSMPVNFSNQLIIGKQISGFPELDEIEKQVYMDKNNNKIIYNISHRSPYIKDHELTCTFDGLGNFAIEGQPLGVIKGNFAVRDILIDSMLVHSNGFTHSNVWIAIPIPPSGYKIEVNYNIIRLPRF